MQQDHEDQQQGRDSEKKKFRLMISVIVKLETNRENLGNPNLKFKVLKTEETIRKGIKILNSNNDDIKNGLKMVPIYRPALIERGDRAHITSPKESNMNKK
ncbi:hypothetical protein KEM48_001078 [Puccinia striiformis f. sp. tritici PST-130]|nr:hypothetical protein KEM48_001078 [Puccinia striiformis f. sp. tritici PST-130]